MRPRAPIPPTRPRATDIPRRRALAAIALGAGTALTGCSITTGGVVAPDQRAIRLSKRPAPGRERTIELYNVHGNRAGTAWCALADLYERSQGHTAVKVTYAPASAETQVRLLTAIAAGTPPDIGFVEPERYPQLVGLGVATRLDERLAAAGLTEERYAPAVWSQMTATGGIYSVPGQIDPNFPLFWNKKVFEDVGLDPEVPPETIDDLDRMSEKILVKDGGRVTRIGTAPWSYYGYANSMFTVGFAFGGAFVTDDNQEATTDDPHLVEGLTWMCDYAKRVGGAGSISLSSPSETLPPIAYGRMGMAPLVGTDAANVYANSDSGTVDLGASLFPYAEGMGSKGSSIWLGGWNLFIPKEAKEPDAAWDFLQFATATDQGTGENYEIQNAIPGLVDSPVLQTMADDPQRAMFRDAFLTCRNTRPVIPVSNIYSQQLEIYVGQAVFGELTPRKALTKVKDVVNEQWERFRKEHP